MACWYPIPIHEREIMVPCGKCLGCLTARRNQWTFRLMQEERVSKSSMFITLTYSDKFLPLIGNNPVLKKSDFQNYIKRLRKVNQKLRYYAVGEYGTRTERPHYHAIMFNAKKKDAVEKWRSSDEEIGNVFIGDVNQASIHYVTGYLVNNKLDKNDPRESPFSLMSKGLGSNYVDIAREYHQENVELQVTFPDGKKINMPRYYKDKFFEKDHLNALGFDNLLIHNEQVRKQNYLEFLQARENRRTKFSKNKKFKNL